MQNELESAEEAVTEFIKVNRGHKRVADATFWLGCVQFMRGKYEKAAITVSGFNTKYIDDPRLVETTAWIVEPVSHFAPREQACKL